MAEIDEIYCRKVRIKSSGGFVQNLCQTLLTLYFQGILYIIFYGHLLTITLQFINI
jgi:hypothetical protein